MWILFRVISTITRNKSTAMGYFGEENNKENTEPLQEITKKKATDLKL